VNEEIRVSDLRESVVITLPAGYKFSTIEEALKQCAMYEYSEKLKLFYEGLSFKEQVAALQAENERLRKAGDAVIEKLAEAYAGEPSDFDHAHVFKGWIEAKGVQS
jgi:hypothetical protein